FSRAAWHAVGGLDPRLKFGLDWDLIIRIADRHPVTLINEFLSCSREYENTKTASGGITRALELCEISYRHTGRHLTIGTLVYLLETLHGSPMDDRAEPLRAPIAAAEQRAFQALASVAGEADGFPSLVDQGDFIFLPFAAEGQSLFPKGDSQGL